LQLTPTNQPGKNFFFFQLSWPTCPVVVARETTTKNNHYTSHSTNGTLEPNKVVFLCLFFGKNTNFEGQKKKKKKRNNNKKKTPTKAAHLPKMFQ